MVKKMSILDYRINFVFRHKYEKKMDLLDKMEWRDYRFGIWFKKYKAVGKPKNGPAVIGKSGTLTNCYMFGVDLILCKFWFDISYRPLTLKID